MAVSTNIKHDWEPKVTIKYLENSYGETFSNVVKPVIIRALLTLTLTYK